MESTGKRLTEQFYAWERLGRGMHVAAHPIELEPPFTPFFGHILRSSTVIDDGKKPHWFKTMLWGDEGKYTVIDEYCTETITPFPDGENAPLHVCSVVIPKHYEHAPHQLEQVLILLSYRTSPISFELIGTADTITMQWCCRDTDSAFLLTQLRAFFPACAIHKAPIDALAAALDTSLPVYTVDFGLAQEYMRPLATESDTHDPYTALVGIMHLLARDTTVILQVFFCGTHNAWAESMLKAVCDEGGEQSFFWDAPEMPRLAGEKVSAPLYAVTVRLVTIAPTLTTARELLHHSATALMHASASASNELMPLSNSDYNCTTRLNDIIVRKTHRLGMLLNSKELTTLVHFPSAALSAKLTKDRYTTNAAPEAVHGDEYVLGINTHQGITHPVSLSIPQRTRHIHIMGATGTGKSTLLLNLIQQDIASGVGCVVLDPHGDLIDRVVETIPLERIRDVIVVDPTDPTHTIAFNILCAHSDIEREVLSSDLVALFRRFSTSWGDQMNSVFANAISAFLYNTTIGTLADLRRFLIEKPYRNQILVTVTDPDIAYYWHKEFPLLKSTSIGPILTRLDGFLRPKAIRNMVSQQGSLNFQDIMDTNKIVLVKLSQGVLGAENSYLLGAVIVAKLQQTAMARQVQHLHHRTPFFCYIDEFHHFITPSMATILSGARKYNVGLVLAHQDMQQVSKYDADVASSVLSNCGTRIYFRLGDTDAKRLHDGFSAFSADDFQRLPIGQAIARVNTADADFNLAIVPQQTFDDVVEREDVLLYSRIAYGTPIAVPPSPPPATSALIAPTVSVRAPVPEATPIDPQPVREHVYTQNLIKLMAEQRGYTAKIEVPTRDGTGQVDVVLERGTERIAVEVSVSTGAQWEVHNMQKCLAGDYTKIVVCATSAKKLDAIRTRMEAILTVAEQTRVQLLTTNDIPTLFILPSNPTHSGTTMKGYRVNVAYDTGTADTTKEDIIKRIITGAKR